MENAHVRHVHKDYVIWEDFEEGLPCGICRDPNNLLFAVEGKQNKWGEDALACDCGWTDADPTREGT